ncbi:MAG TPA: hypothetical protein VIJ59_08675 [Caulobacteraceae bacterium]
MHTRFVGLPSPTAPRAGAGGHPCQGLYLAPEGARPKTAIIAAHYNVDFAEHYLGPYFVERGFGFLGWNTRYRGAEDQFLLEHALIDIGVGVRWLREDAGVERIVILGNSGGGSLMGAYQAQAGSPSLTLAGRGAETLAALPAADLYISLNAHQGRPEVLTAWMDASVIDEGDPVATDPALDPFRPDNAPPYTDDFIARYRAAQIARNQKITDWAKAEMARLQVAGVPDRLFPLFRCWADLRFMDAAIDPSERPPGRCYAGDPAAANRRPGVGRANMLGTWLSMWSLETSPCRGEPHLKRIATPALVIQSVADCGVFPSDAHAIHDALGSADKSLAFVKGAHYFEDSEAHRATVADLMADWIGARR